MHIIEKEKYKHNLQKQEKELQKLKRELDAIRTRAKKWRYMFVEELISSDTMRESLNEESAKETQIKECIDEMARVKRETNEVQVQLLEVAELCTSRMLGIEVQKKTQM